jgi:acyl-coenzyme A thioesterase PaaI-like protein
MVTIESLNSIGVGKLPGHLGIVITRVDKSEVIAELAITNRSWHPMGTSTRAPVTIADTCAGYGCLATLPPGASGFTTIELKSNHLGTALKEHRRGRETGASR